MSKKGITDPENPFHDLAPIAETPMASAEGIAGLALNFALKWHDICIVKDGALYQAKKAEGKNFRLIDLPDVLMTAARFEKWLLDAPERLMKVLETGQLEIVVPIPGDGTDEPEPGEDG